MEYGGFQWMEETLMQQSTQAAGILDPVGGTGRGMFCRGGASGVVVWRRQLTRSLVGGACLDRVAGALDAFGQLCAHPSLGSFTRIVYAEHLLPSIHLSHIKLDGHTQTPPSQQD